MINPKLIRRPKKIPIRPVKNPCLKMMLWILFFEAPLAVKIPKCLIF